MADKIDPMWIGSVRGMATKNPEVLTKDGWIPIETDADIINRLKKEIEELKKNEWRCPVGCASNYRE